GFPTDDDFAYHLTTLFPPVRARGWLELRMLDALPDDWWPVAAAVTTALLDDAETAAEAADVVGGFGTTRLWREAARSGAACQALNKAARRCFAAALTALPRLGGDDATVAARAAFADRHVARGR